MLFGGASLGSKRYIWWNFVSSSKERIEQAKEEWQTGRFDIVPGDEEEFIPLPETNEFAKRAWFRDHVARKQGLESAGISCFDALYFGAGRVTDTHLLSQAGGLSRR